MSVTGHVTQILHNEEVGPAEVEFSQMRVSSIDYQQ